MGILDTLGSFCGMFNDLISCPHELSTNVPMSQIQMEDELIYIPHSCLLLARSQTRASFHSLQ